MREFTSRPLVPQFPTNATNAFYQGCGLRRDPGTIAKVTRQTTFPFADYTGK
jgi:hypothetical protein